MITIPEIQARSFVVEDADDIVELLNQTEKEFTGGEMLTREELVSDLSSPGFSVDSDTQVLLLPNGKLAAYAEFWDTVDPHVRFFAFMRASRVEDEAVLYQKMVYWSEDKAFMKLANAPEGARVVIHNRQLPKNLVANKILVENGYEHVRTHYRMKIMLNQEPPEPVVPDGVTIRPIRAGDEDDLREAMKADYEAFLDHWGFIPEPFDNYYQHWKHRLFSTSEMRLEDCFVATDGERAAGVALCSHKVVHGPEWGWVNSLGVRKEYRKRGIGLALLQTAFRHFHLQGKTIVALGVDASNLTGALKLYQQAGMQVDNEFWLFEKEIRPGFDLMTQNVSQT